MIGVGILRLRSPGLVTSECARRGTAFTHNPAWSVQGIVDIVVGAGTLTAPVCPNSMVGGARATCLSWVLRRHALAYREVSTVWH